MGASEFYYNRAMFDATGLNPFIKHAREYLAGQRTVPVAVTRRMLLPDERQDERCYFTFSDDLLYQMVRDPRSLKKPYESAIKYGLGGYSKGGKNGIFLVRESDGKVAAAVPRLTREHIGEIAEDLLVEKEQWDQLRGVKIVWHEPSGERVVGVMNPENSRIIFLGVARYRF